MAGNITNIQGTYTGALSSSGPVFVGTENSTENAVDIPVLVTGRNTSASALGEHSVVCGVNAKATAPYSVVFNGSSLVEQYTGSGDEGTISVNPNGGTNGLYIGSLSFETHMRNLSGFTMDCLTSVSYGNNLLHRSGNENAYGIKTFSDGTVFGNSTEKTSIKSSSINISSNGGGGILFHWNGSDSPTSSLYESENGRISIGSDISVGGDSEFNSSINIFSGLSLSNGAMADFSNGTVYASTKVYNVGDLGDNTVATTKYVKDAIDTSATSGISDKNMVFRGSLEFAGPISLASSTIADFTKGYVYVRNVSIGTPEGYSSIAANTKFVTDVASSYISSLRDGKSSIGSSIVPIYLKDGKIRQFESDIGSPNVPIFISGGSLKQSDETVGSEKQPLYMFKGSLLKCANMVTVDGSQGIYGEKTFFEDTYFYRHAHVYRDAYFYSGIIFNTNGCIYSDVGGLSIFPKNNLIPEENTAASIRLGIADVGSSISPVYVKGGRITRLTGYVGSSTKPIYLSEGEICEFSKNIGSSLKPVYLSSGNIVEFSSSLGSVTRPVYLKDGSFHECDEIVGVYSNQFIYGEKHFTERTFFDDGLNIKGNTISVTSDGALYLNSKSNTSSSIYLGTSTIGSSDRPVYLNNGIITECGSNPRIVGFVTIGNNVGNGSLDINAIPYLSRPSSIRITYTNKSLSSILSASIKRLLGSESYGKKINPWEVWTKDFQYVGTSGTVDLFGFYQQLSYLTCTISLLAY